MNRLHPAETKEIKRLRSKGLLRNRLIVDKMQAQGAINFCSNDYLAFADNESVKKAYQTGFEKYPNGSGGSALICGYRSIHREFEQVVATALGVDDAMLFSSGYAANLGVMTALVKMQAELLIDKGLHASFYDGIQNPAARYQRFLHNDMVDLAQKLDLSTGNSVIISEGIFSMSGQIAPLDNISALANQHQAVCIIDEAHSFGIMGEHGLGAVHQFSLTQYEVPLRIIPLGKAFGAQGAIVAGSAEWIDALVQLARSHFYSTAISPALTYGLLATFFLLYEADDRRQVLKKRVGYFRKAIKNSPLKWTDSDTAIQQLQLGCPLLALSYAAELSKRGIFCQAIREPTVGKKQTGIRIVLNVHHEEQDIDYFFHNLHLIYESLY